jgi:hypothetical protein
VLPSHAAALLKPVDRTVNGRCRAAKGSNFRDHQRDYGVLQLPAFKADNRLSDHFQSLGVPAGDLGLILTFLADKNVCTAHCEDALNESNFARDDARA